MKVSVWPDSLAGPALMAVAQPATVCGAASSLHRLVGARGEAGRVVDGGDVDGERVGVWIEVDAAVGGAAVVAAPGR